MATAQATTSTSTNKPAVPATPPPFKLSTIKRGANYIKMLVYGKHGVGKTTFAGTAADVDDMNDVFMINAESGEMVMMDNRMIKNPERIISAKVNTFKQVTKMYEFLSSHVKMRDRFDENPDDEETKQKMIGYEAWLFGIDPEEIKAPRMFRTVILDSLTEIEAYCMYGLLGITGDFDISQIDDEMKTAEYAEYKKNNNMVNLLVRAFRDLPMNVIVLTASAYEQDELKRYHYAPALTGRLRNQVQGYFDIVGYLAAEAPKEDGLGSRRLFVQPIGKFDAKNRLAAFRDPSIEDPTLGKIFAKLGKDKG